MKTPELLHVYFDYVDPACFLMERRIRGLEEAHGIPLVLEPFELRPPPGPLLDPQAREWRTHLEAMEAEGEAAGLRFTRPWLVPWTRKAHELGLHAREHGCFRKVHDALFQAYLLEGRDIGRVDVLVELGAEAGLDRMEVKAALDVDRHRQEVERRRERALALGINGVPTLLWRETRLEGYPGKERLRELLVAPEAIEQP